MIIEWLVANATAVGPLTKRNLIFWYAFERFLPNPGRCYGRVIEPLCDVATLAQAL